MSTGIEMPEAVDGVRVGAAGGPIAAVIAAATTTEGRHGRPRDPHVDSAIRKAALELLVEEGFARMSMEAVATRAGVGKAAIYRRWDNKTALVVDAIHDIVANKYDWPHTDDIRADLEVIFSKAVEKMRGIEGGLMSSVVSELVRNRELAETVRAQFIGCQRSDIVDRIRQAMESGELPPGNAELLAEVGFAIIHHRTLLSDAPLTDDLPAQLVEQFFPRVPASAGQEGRE
jgi:AcrR family transcriptional regulator